MSNNPPHIFWDSGTAYDLFASLHVLHHAERFGLRGSWAAGVRSRLTMPQRAILEDAEELFINSPLAWVSCLPEPRDSGIVLSSLNQILPVDRLPALAFHANVAPEIFDILNEIFARRTWSESDLDSIRRVWRATEQASKTDKLIKILDWWSHPEEFGERYLEALQAYVTVFYSEEERRIRPTIQQAVETAQELATRLDFSRLFIELSQGVKIAALEEAEQVILVPSYWTTPLVMYDCVIEKHWVVLFGARPADVALIPGEVIPDAMIRAIKALSDPTRLRILRYLSGQPQTPSQLAKRLRLRSPTVIHHLNVLRLAGLVYITLVEKEEKRYAVRESVVGDTFNALRRFLTEK